MIRIQNYILIIQKSQNNKQYLPIETIKKMIDLNIEGKLMKAEHRQIWDKLDRRSKINVLLDKFIKHHKIKLDDSWDINQLVNKLMNQEGKPQEAILNPDCQTSVNKGKTRADFDETSRDKGEKRAFDDQLDYNNLIMIISYFKDYISDKQVDFNPLEFVNMSNNNKNTIIKDVIKSIYTEMLDLKASEQITQQIFEKLEDKEREFLVYLNPENQTSRDNHKKKADQLDDLYQQGASQRPRMSQLGLNQSGSVIPSQIQRGGIYQQGSPAGLSEIIEKPGNN